MSKEKNDYFIRVANPRDARRLILENSRDVLKVLQGYEEFKHIRKERSMLIDKFKLQTNEVRSLVLQLKKMLPKTNIRDVRKVVAVQQPANSKQPRELRKLEEELAAIEAKLNDI